MERLHQTHDSLRAYRPPGALEAILGHSAPRVQPELILIQPEVQTQPESFEVQPEGQVEPDIPQLGGIIPVRVELRFDLWPQTTVADPAEYEMRPAPVCPSRGFICKEHEPAKAGRTEIVALGLTGRDEPAHVLQNGVTPREAAMRPVQSLSLSVSPQNEELQRLLEDFRARADEQVPQLQTPYAMAAPSPRESAATRVQEAVESLPPSGMPVLGPQFPASAARLHAEPAPGAPLPVPSSHSARAAEWHGTTAGNLGVVDDLRRASEVLQFALATPALRPRLRLAPGTRYSVPTRPSIPAAAALELAELPAQTPDIALPQRQAKAMAAAAASRSSKAVKVQAQSNVPVPDAAGPIPEAAGLLPLRLAGATAKTVEKPMNAALSQGMIPQPPRTALMHPVSKLEPFDEKPASDFMPPPPAELMDEEDDPTRKAHIWTHAADFLRHAPRDLKTLVVAIPVLLGLALHPSLPKVRLSAPSSAAATGIQHSVEHALNEQLVIVRQTMADRAGVALDEDFRSGLDEWVSRGDATAEWSFDATGFVRPGPLALYRPSVGLTDYQFQFLGMIDQKALSWVVRAADFENYYVIKLTVLKPGPLPTIGLTRYAVINGRADSRVDTIAPIDARPDTLYRVRLDVQGSEYVLTVQGQIADAWTEKRLKRGGVQFFSARDEESRVRWVQVTHQYDMLGRLCAYLAPYNILSTNGSW